LQEINIPEKTHAQAQANAQGKGQAPIALAVSVVPQAMTLPPVFDTCSWTINKNEQILHPHKAFPIIGGYPY